MVPLSRCEKCSAFRDLGPVFAAVWGAADERCANDLQLLRKRYEADVECECCTEYGWAPEPCGRCKLVRLWGGKVSDHPGLVNDQDTKGNVHGHV